MTDTNTRTDQPSKNNKPEYEENKRFIKEGNKKLRVRKIYSKYIPKIKAIYYKQAITKNTDLEQKEKFLEAYQKEKQNLIDMGLIILDIKILKSQKIK